MIRIVTAFAALLSVALPVVATAGTVADPVVERTGPHSLAISWSDRDPVDVLVADRPDASPAAARLVSPRDADGRHVLEESGAGRSYVLLRDMRSGRIVPVAERLVPLAGGSNFRDIGGYPAAGGKHVRWGMIYRSGASALLTAEDLARVRGLGLANMVDLRSDEERVLAPSRIDGVPYTAVGYSMGEMGFTGGMEAGYRQMPTQFAPQLRLIFAKLLRQEGPLAYNCSAGQDRTGFTTAVVLTALGVPRETILADYHLSTIYRRPQNEMPRIDLATAASNPVAAMFAQYQRVPNQRPQPLKTADGKAFLLFALEAIEAKWGSVDGYLEHELGVGPAELRRLRALYTD